MKIKLKFLFKFRYYFSIIDMHDSEDIEVLFMMELINNFKDVYGLWIDLGIGVILTIILCCTAVKVSHRKVYIGIILTSFIIVFASIFFKFYITAITVGFVMVLFFTWFANNYSNNLKKIFKKIK